MCVCFQGVRSFNSLLLFQIPDKPLYLPQTSLVVPQWLHLLCVFSVMAPAIAIVMACLTSMLDCVFLNGNMHTGNV